MSFAEFIDMGGQGFYIWTCYIVTLVLFVGMVVILKLKQKKLVLKLLRRYRTQKIHNDKI